MRRASKDDKTIVTNILTQSFDDNRSVNYVVRQDRHRVDRIKRLMEYSFNVCQAFGEIWISDDNQACALVLFPDQKKTSLNTIIWDINLAISSIGISRIGKVLKRETQIKSHHPDKPLCYLWFIGVMRESQAQGLGTKLIKSIIHECEKKERPIYLETSMERNLPWYQKFGFEIYHTVELSYKLYLLRRTPKSA